MVRHKLILVAAVALLSSTACSIHVTTGPASALYRSTPAQPSGIVWASAPNVTEPQHHNAAPASGGDRDQQQRPSPRATGTVNPQHAGPNNREVITIAHTGDRPAEKPTGDLGQWRPSVNGHSSSVATSDKPRPHLGPHSNGGHAVSGGNSIAEQRDSLSRGDGRLQQVARQDRK